MLGSTPGYKKGKASNQLRKAHSKDGAAAMTTAGAGTEPRGLRGEGTGKALHVCSLFPGGREKKEGGTLPRNSARNTAEREQEF